MPKLILCVDDDSAGLRLQEIILTKSGYQVLTAESGPRGLELFREYPVDAVLLDFRMPGMDGDEVARIMRAEKPEVPLILLSGFMQPPAETIQLIDSFLPKGAPTQQMLSTLEQVLSTPASAPEPASPESDASES